uniref:Floricaula/leafy-like transcription factor n=1 Tax=Angiopteris lygodiifolia TaxID=3267 RepID=Q8LSS9_ANGLY|nr:LFY homolog [Angiopteris lygodiifolia]
MKSLEELFKDYGVRYSTLAKMSEMGFTVNTLVNMTEQELEDLVMVILESCQVQLLVGEKYGIKSAVRAEKKRVDEECERLRLDMFSKAARKRKIDEPAALLAPKEGVAKESHRDDSIILTDTVNSILPLNFKEPLLIGQDSVHLGACGLVSQSDPGSDSEGRKFSKKQQKRRPSMETGEDGEDRPREHPFIVTEPGELARGKKNGLDYLFDLYEQCGRLLQEVQRISKERGEKCPTKVTNQVFRHAKHNGCGYINKPKMRHYVHCYALHCLDTEQSNNLRRLYKERGENVGAWRQACYHPLVAMARENDWDIEGLFTRNEKLRIWYVPTKLRQLCHSEKSRDSE